MNAQMAKAKIVNPRGYLSWTQVDTWLRDPRKYARKYFEGEEEAPTEQMTLGKRTSDALESGKETGDVEIDTLVALLPHYQKREHEIKATLKTRAGDVVLLGKLDTFGMAPIRFREYKTGRVAWTQSRAEKHKQLLHYAALIWLFHGKLPSEVWLDWAQTEWRGGQLCFTGKIVSFRVEIGTKEVLMYLALVSRVATEIDQSYRAYLKNLT